MTKNSAPANGKNRKQALAAALSLLSASLGVTLTSPAESQVLKGAQPGDSNQVEGDWIKHDATSVQHKTDVTSSQIKGQSQKLNATSTQIKGNFIKLNPSGQSPQ